MYASHIIYTIDEKVHKIIVLGVEFQSAEALFVTSIAPYTRRVINSHVGLYRTCTVRRVCLIVCFSIRMLLKQVRGKLLFVIPR